MSENRKNESFSYTYDAKQQQEVRKLREKYLPREEDKMERLRRLDESVTSKGTAAALIVSIPSTLLMGTGMSCCMVFAGVWFIPGILLGLIGMVGIAAAYPLYKSVVERERKRIAPEIIRLTDELLK